MRLEIAIIFSISDTSNSIAALHIYLNPYFWSSCSRLKRNAFAHPSDPLRVSPRCSSPCSPERSEVSRPTHIIRGHSD